jgi:hypothetical protein
MLVSVGYVGAAVLALAVVAAYIGATSGPDRQTYGAMFAFGDALLFLALFAVAAVVPSGAALYFLRPYRSFWTALSVAGLVVAGTAVAAFLNHLTWFFAGPQAAGTAWSALASLRILITPLFTVAFVVSAVFAPTRRPRLALLASTAIEAAVFVGWASITLSHR